MLTTYTINRCGATLFAAVPIDRTEGAVLTNHGLDNLPCFGDALTTFVTNYSPSACALPRTSLPTMRRRVGGIDRQAAMCIQLWG